MGLFSRGTKEDILAKKQAELTQYTEQFDASVSLVTSTIDNLKRINEGIQEKIGEIEDYQSELAKTRNGLDSAKSKNERIIQNFSALLGE